MLRMICSLLKIIISVFNLSLKKKERKINYLLICSEVGYSTFCKIQGQLFSKEGSIVRALSRLFRTLKHL